MMRLTELTQLAGLTKIKLAPGRATALYWAHHFEQMLGHKASSDKEQLIVQAILDQAKYKYVMSEGDQIVGAIAFAESDQYDGDTQNCVLVTAIGSMKTGVGTELMKLPIKLARRKKIPVVVEASESSPGFYAKLGFKHQWGSVWELR